MWKGDCLQNLIIGWAILRNNNFDNWQWVLQSRGAILAQSSLQNCCTSATSEGFWESTFYLKAMPHHLNRIQVKTLTRPLQSLHFVFLKPFRSGLAGVFWIVVLLQNPLQLEVTNRWPDIVLQDFLVGSRIHDSIYHSKFLLLSSGGHLGTLPCRPCLQSLFLMVESPTLTLNEASEAWSSSDVVLGSCDLLDESSLHYWGNFGQPATPGKVHHCPCYHHL